MFIDFSDYPLSHVYYGGSERKIGIFIGAEKYMLKFQKETSFGKRYNHISEYLGSHIFELLGFDVHKTFLGVYQGRQVVACKDFIADGIQFVPFNDVGESSLETDKEKYQYSYEDIVALLEKNRKLTDVNETISVFFEMFIVDALLGNFDRHGANWGFLKKNNKYTLAPIFDNGSSLYPQMVNEDEMNMVINDQEEMDKRVYQFPTSQIRLHGRKSSYYEVISSLEFDECNKALRKIYSRIDMRKINSLIDDLPVSEIHRQFYKVMLKERYVKIIRYSYEKLMEAEHE